MSLSYEKMEQALEQALAQASSRPRLSRFLQSLVEGLVQWQGRADEVAGQAVIANMNRAVAAAFEARAGATIRPAGQEALLPSDGGASPRQLTPVRVLSVGYTFPVGTACIYRPPLQISRYLWQAAGDPIPGDAPGLSLVPLPAGDTAPGDSADAACAPESPNCPQQDRGETPAVFAELVADALGAFISKVIRDGAAARVSEVAVWLGDADGQTRFFFYGAYDRGPCENEIAYRPGTYLTADYPISQSFKDWLIIHRPGAAQVIADKGLQRLRLLVGLDRKFRPALYRLEFDGVAAPTLSLPRSATPEQARLAVQELIGAWALLKDFDRDFVGDALFLVLDQHPDELDNRRAGTLPAAVLARILQQEINIPIDVIHRDGFMVTIRLPDGTTAVIDELHFPKDK